MKSQTLSKSGITEINSKLKDMYAVEPLRKKDNALLLEDENLKIKFLKVNGSILFFYQNDIILPTLKNMMQHNFLKKITVDMGAIKFLCSGADLMRPGIVAIEEGINSGDIVSVIDVNNKKLLIIGKALLNTFDMRNQKSGKSALNLHYVGDGIWKLT
jgi:PUA-domain protein